MSLTLRVYICGASNQSDRLARDLKDLGHFVTRQQKPNLKQMEDAHIVFRVLSRDEASSILESESAAVLETIPRRLRNKIAILFPRGLLESEAMKITRSSLRGWSGFNTCIPVPGSKEETQQIVVDVLSNL